MHYFTYHLNELYCEEVPVKEIVNQFGTPIYIYSARTIRRHFSVFSASFKEVDHLVCYSVKANSNLAVLALLGKEGAGADVVSAGELVRALKAGLPASKIVYSGVGKRPDEVELALKAGILMFNVESLEELECLGEIAKSVGIKAPFALRVNPNVDPKTHPYISTGLKKE
jgi:diaminopimelate decarboxylase